MKICLRQKEKHAANALRADGTPGVAGLCLKCAQHEAVLAGTHTNLHVQAIDRLTKSVVTQAQVSHSSTSTLHTLTLLLSSLTEFLFC